MTEPIKLPPLPTPDADHYDTGTFAPVWKQGKMEAHARAAIEADRQARGEPFAWATHHDEPMLFPTFKEAAAYCDDDEEPIPLFTGEHPQQIPEGYKLVPVELLNFIAAKEHHLPVEDRHCLRIMLEAAPEPKENP